MTMKSMIEAEEKAAQQEHQERVLKMLAPGTARTFDHMAPWTP
jgi:type IV secretion system protein VirB5